MPEEFFTKTCLTRSFISGAAYPAHNPLMVWCYMWKKNFLLKGIKRFFDTSTQRGTYGPIRGGGMNI